MIHSLNVDRGERLSQYNIMTRTSMTNSCSICFFESSRNPFEIDESSREQTTFVGTVEYLTLFHLFVESIHVGSFLHSPERNRSIFDLFLEPSDLGSQLDGTSMDRFVIE